VRTKATPKSNLSRNPFSATSRNKRCGKHLPVGEDGEFVWDDGTDEKVGT
jgi:hypothetical protein